MPTVIPGIYWHNLHILSRLPEQSGNRFRPNRHRAAETRHVGNQTTELSNLRYESAVASGTVNNRRRSQSGSEENFMRGTL